MNLDKLQASRTRNGEVEIAWYEGGHPNGIPVLLIHGFASTAHTNWVFPGWFKTLGEAGYRVLALDNRGHGLSAKPYDEDAYSPELMASDAAAVLEDAGITSAHIFGYSMGARNTAFLALSRPGLIKSVVFGGLGMGMVDGVGDWDPIAKALLAPSLEEVTDRRGRMFRAFAEQTGSDRKALAACISKSRKLVALDDLELITQPALVGVGTTDDIAGSGEEFAALLPNGRHFAIKGRDHMLAVGDKTFKSAVLEFYKDVERGED